MDTTTLAVTIAICWSILCAGLALAYVAAVQRLRRQRDAHLQSEIDLLTAEVKEANRILTEELNITRLERGWHYD